MSKKKQRNTAKRNILQLESEFNSLRPSLVDLDAELLRQLTQLLEGASVSLGFPIQHRVKTWSSIVDKLQRVPLSLKSLRDMQDLVGFRIVLQFRRDVERVCTLIEQNLKILDRYDTVERLREDQFGYASVHCVVEVPQAWLAVPTMTGLANLCAEVQVRTTAQHIWAEASQTLQYKSEEAVPPALRRAIYRVSALLETVDLEFERVLADRALYKAKVAQSSHSTEALNVDTLEQVLDEAWPSANKDAGRENYAELLSDLTTLGVATADAVRKLISKWHTTVLTDDARRVSALRGDLEEIELQRARKDRIDKGVFFTHCGLTRVALAGEFPERWNEYSQKRFAPRGMA